jgi:hypothetical protein
VIAGIPGAPLGIEANYRAAKLLGDISGVVGGSIVDNNDLIVFER